MLALHSHGWIQKGVLQRHGGGVVTMLSKIKLDGADRRTEQNWSFRLKCAGDKVADFHTSALSCKNLLKKMLSSKRKKKWYETPQPAFTGQPSFTKPTKKRSSEDSLRVRTLNTILYKAISDLLSSHEVNADIPSYNVELTKVSLLADYSTCRIYWKTSLSSDRDRQIQQALDKCAARIRYLLISQQILGSVPPLVFVLDKQHAALKEVEDLLKIADYGPSEDAETLSLCGKDAETKVQPVEKRRIVFGIDHDALYKQMEDFKQRSGDAGVQAASSASLTQEQLDMLAEIRKQKLIEKKKRKAKQRKDDDITPKEFLLARQLQKEEQQEQDHSLEDSQASELMLNERKR